MYFCAVLAQFAFLQINKSNNFSLRRRSNAKIGGNLRRFDFGRDFIKETVIC